jgi:hypothetical protein
MSSPVREKNHVFVVSEAPKRNNQFEPPKEPRRIWCILEAKPEVELHGPKQLNRSVLV